jgi:hypothetical protein
MTAQPVVLADHSVLLAIPAFAPAVVVVGVVIYVAMRDRRRRSDGPHGENQEPSGQDGSP